jgi:hypothetical protein
MSMALQCAPFAAKAAAVLPRSFDWLGVGLGLGLEVDTRPNSGPPYMLLAAAKITLELAAPAVRRGGARLDNLCWSDRFAWAADRRS